MGYMPPTQAELTLATRSECVCRPWEGTCPAPWGSLAETPLSSTVNGSPGDVQMHGDPAPPGGFQRLTAALPAPSFACFLGCTKAWCVCRQRAHRCPGSLRA